LDVGLTGVVARASGIDLDLRHALPNGLYAAHPPQTLTESSGDCWARMSQRMGEAQASTQWLIDRLADPALNLSDCPDPFAAGGLTGEWALMPDTLVVSLVEGVRGPVMVALETDATGKLIHAKVQDPSLANWFGLAFALRGQQISDFPICNKSFDLSYCGNDL
jgi:Ni,Fe-hydrogenase III large subunit